jgi:glycosyltransferase involved in cell wall biosynthesis
MRVLIVIPVFNEQAQLAQSITALQNFLHAEFTGHLTTNHPLLGERAGVRGNSSDKSGVPSRRVPRSQTFDYEIIIADNGSTDGTSEIAHHLATTLPAVTAMHLPLKGRGRALRRAWTESEADILSYMDVDLSTDLSAFPPLIEALSSGHFDLAIGTRLHLDSHTERCWRREVISRAYNRLVKFLFAPPFSDAQCGFKAITRGAARQLLPSVEDENWFFDTELLLIAVKSGYRICEVPVTWIEDPDSRVKIIPTAWAQFKGLMRVQRNMRRGAYAPLPTALHPQPSSSAGR